MRWVYGSTSHTVSGARFCANSEAQVLACLLPSRPAMAKPRKRDSVGVSSSDAGAPRNSGDTTVATLDREQVAARAYEIYQERGGTDGMDLDDWLRAERELMQRQS